jgi:hypothetical protein
MTSRQLEALERHECASLIVLTSPGRLLSLQAVALQSHVRSCVTQTATEQQTGLIHNLTTAVRDRLTD